MREDEGEVVARLAAAVPRLEVVADDAVEREVVGPRRERTRRIAPPQHRFVRRLGGGRAGPGRRQPAQARKRSATARRHPRPRLRKQSGPAAPPARATTARRRLPPPGPARRAGCPTAGRGRAPDPGLGQEVDGAKLGVEAELRVSRALGRLKEERELRVERKRRDGVLVEIGLRQRAFETKDRRGRLSSQIGEVGREKLLTDLQVGCGFVEVVLLHDDGLAGNVMRCEGAEGSGVALCGLQAVVERDLDRPVGARGRDDVADAQVDQVEMRHQQTLEDWQETLSVANALAAEDGLHRLRLEVTVHALHPDGDVVAVDRPEAAGDVVEGRAGLDPPGEGVGRCTEEQASVDDKSFAGILRLGQPEQHRLLPPAGHARVVHDRGRDMLHVISGKGEA